MFARSKARLSLFPSISGNPMLDVDIGIESLLPYLSYYY